MTAKSGTPDAVEPDPRLNAWRPDLADIALKGRVDAAKFVTGRPMRVVAPVAPVRRAPRPDAALDTEALAGEAVAIFQVDAEGWAWGQLQRDRYVGWLPADALVAAPDGTPEPDYRVCVPRTLVFPGPDIKLPPLTALPLGAMVVVEGAAPGPDTAFARIAPAGFVPVGHLTPVERSAESDRADGFADYPTDFVTVAESLVGAPYLWGGKTLMGLDCSGLVQIALHTTGRHAPRDTDMQERELGLALDPAAAPDGLRRGDLVFWRRHVGIMRTGRDLLHANAHHMAVKSERLADVISRIGEKGLYVTGIRRMM